MPLHEDLRIRSTVNSAYAVRERERITLRGEHMGKHEGQADFTSEQDAILSVANALAATANRLASSAVRTNKATVLFAPGYTAGYVAALQDLLDEVGAVVPVGWQAP